MRTPNARISRVHNSWRVRVFGHPATYFADSAYGGTAEALEAARAWRDERWDGRDRFRKLSATQRAEIQRSSMHYKEIAERYGITPTYVHQLRREAR